MKMRADIRRWIHLALLATLLSVPVVAAASVVDLSEIVVTGYGDP